MNTKKCSACELTKPTTQFGKNSIKQDGLCAACKDCRNKRKKRHYDNNRESEVRKAAEWNKRNPDRVRENKRRSYHANADMVRENARKKYAANRDKIAAQNAEWRKANPAKCREIKARRRAAKLQRTPTWLNAAQRIQIAEIYKSAAALSATLGISLHVDHIVPLQGELVSGLHVPWNLQILVGEDNNRKYNHLPENLRNWF
jgi:5-methylcytosine-specific restriction endonuclease McrA